MRSFEHGYLLEQPISQSLLMTVRTLGEYQGRQSLYQEQAPELLETLRQVAMIQSVESSNRIEGVTVAADRLQAIYEALLKSSHGWHEAKHDLRPWWNYFLGTLIAAYREFEERVRVLTTARGAKREIVRQAAARLPDQFTIQELRRACPGVSPDMVRLVLRELQKENVLSCEGRGPGALWRKKGNLPKKG